jgi:tape measure domain-containing protein
MAPVTTELKVLVKAVGKGELKELEAALNKLAVTAKTRVDVNFKQVATQLKDVQRTSKNSIQNLRDYRNAWRDISAQLEIGSKEFKEARLEAEKLDKQLQKAEGRRPQGSRLGRAARGVGAIAAGGIFGGPEGLVGGAIGLGVGGPAGAAVGAAIGAQVGSIRQSLGSVAEYSAQLGKLRIALEGVSRSQLEYNSALDAIQQATKDFAIPQSVLTKQFTRLKASVSGAGGSLNDTNTAFRGIVAAVRATGGSLQDVDSALTATAQVFSKGKVSAEELRQQIGERLPGAFTIFAESIGKTPAELDKALEKGEVTLEDFLTFSRSLFERYGETAQKIADDPKSAGDRLQVALEKLQENVGPILETIGSEFQKLATIAVNAFSSIANAINKTFNLGEEGKLRTARALRDTQDTLIERFQGQLASGELSAREAASVTELLNLAYTRRNLAEADIREINIGRQGRDRLGSGIIDPLRGLGRPDPTIATGGGRRGGGGRTRAPMSQFEFELRQRINDAREQELDYAQRIAEFDLKIFEINTKLVDDPLKQLDEFRKAEIKLNEQLLKIDESKVKSAEKYEQSIVDAGKSMGENLAKMIPETNKLKDLWKSIGDSISTGVAGAIEGAIFEAKSLQESLSGILRSVASLLIQFGTKSLFSSIGFANGGIMTGQGPLDLKTYARGGIARSPQLAMFGEGSMPEAYVPLPDGRSIPVTMRGGGAGNIVVNVDAKGTQVEGDQGRSKQLGTAISAAVQAELIKQQRPGGLLNR